jgi:hypothetical protein
VTYLYLCTNCDNWWAFTLKKVLELYDSTHDMIHNPPRYIACVKCEEGRLKLHEGVYQKEKEVYKNVYEHKANI